MGEVGRRPSGGGVRRELGRVPTANDLRLCGRTDKSYPNAKVFERLGSKVELVGQLLAYCEATAEFSDVTELCKRYVPRGVQSAVDGSPPEMIGYVYLLRHGTRREFKIGRTNNPIRREGGDLS